MKTSRNKHILDTQHLQKFNSTTVGVQQVPKTKFLGIISEWLRVWRLYFKAFLKTYSGYCKSEIFVFDFLGFDVIFPQRKGKGRGGGEGAKITYSRYLPMLNVEFCHLVFFGSNDKIKILFSEL